jgi:hypothetical protein
MNSSGRSHQRRTSNGTLKMNVGEGDVASDSRIPYLHVAIVEELC